MITRILILFFLCSGFGAREREWSFNNKDVPPPEEINHARSQVNVDVKSNKSSSPLDNQKPPENFPYKNATDVKNNSVLLTKVTETTDNSSQQNINKTEIDTEDIGNKNPVIDSSTANHTDENSTNNNDSGKKIEDVTTTSPPKFTDTEVSDMLNGSKIVLNETDAVLVKNVDYSAVDGPNVELIDDNREDTEDFIRIEHAVPEEDTAVIQGQLAAVLAGVFVVIAIIGYIGLISWRKYLENRYRDRQMLVDDIEFNEREDTRYFTI